MTVYTKIETFDEKPKDLPNLQAIHSPKKEFDAPKVIDSGYKVAAVAWYHGFRRRRIIASVFVAIMVFWFLLAALAGSILLFKHIRRHSMYHGYFTAEFLDQDSAQTKLHERMEIDVNKAFEQIHVPSFGRYRSSQILHDFARNLTAIIDSALGQCFVKALDSVRTVPPLELIDSAKKFQHDRRPKVYNERFKVHRPEMSIVEVRKMGSVLISTQCVTYKTYGLEKMKPSHRKRTRLVRSADGFGLSMDYAYYNGNGVMVQDTIELY